jgi:2-methyl-3-hydroxypyridine 5-carboxylic acid dioxygenase
MHGEIAGAGFAGLTAAIALRRHGWTVLEHEKDAALRAFGAGEDVVQGAHRAVVYETRRDGVCIADQEVNCGNGCRLLSMARQHRYAPNLASAQRAGVELVTTKLARDLRVCWSCLMGVGWKRIW